MNRAGLVVLIGGGLAASVAVACILADPPPLDQPPPQSRPVIISEEVQPPLDQKIGAPPTGVSSLTFTVAVLADPGEPLTWWLLQDFDSVRDTARLSWRAPPDAGTQPLIDNDASQSVQQLSMTVQPSDLEQCHTFTLVVAAAAPGFETNSNAVAVPVYPPGGDRVTWWYQPIDTDTCAYFDAAPPTFQPDGGDAGDGASE
jgi:hypothetical protein